MFLSGRSTIYTFALSVFKIMKSMDERNKLIKELNKFGFDDTLNCCVDVKDIADFILADRRRILMPLIEWKNSEFYEDGEYIKDIIEETFKLSGIE